MKDKTLSNMDQASASSAVPDLQVIGDGDIFQVLSKAWSQEEGWMKSTKAMEIKGLGCVIQVTTQQRNPDGSYSLAESLTWVPGVHLDFSQSPPTLLRSGVIR
jgi:hypothetical protein